MVNKDVLEAGWNRCRTASGKAGKIVLQKIAVGREAA